MRNRNTEPEFNKYHFFASDGEKGMTATSANKLANLAKERNREDMLLIQNVRFYNEVMTLLVKPSEKVVLSEGMNGSQQEFDKLREALLRTARFNAFISWVREAIAAKEALIKEVNDTEVCSWCKKQGIEYPTAPENEVDKEMHESRSAAQATIDEMARYFANQSMASVLGQAIHPEGPIDEARRALIEATMAPSQTEGYGQDTVIKTKEATATTDAVTAFYMALQAEWRHAEAAVNEAKGKWQSADKERLIELVNEYDAKKRDYNLKLAKIEADFGQWQLQETRRLGKLKIRVPAALQPVLDELLTLGKAEQ
ncbi:MAG: hypothetical protein J1E97_01045 [Muribaculaceae bacterium]|nr:hypothetical protein [Muribaculaceae bacterium]